jgi:hypothetical protein
VREQRPELVVGAPGERPARLGWGKFTERHRAEARELVNSSESVAPNLRGINAQGVQSGTGRLGDAVRKLA